jgi:hypothetical protein
MPTIVNFVAAIGRVSAGNLSAMPKIESICAKNGGKVVKGQGSSADPIVAEFASREGAAAAAKEAWYLDDVESAKVVEALTGAGAVAESVEEAPAAKPLIESTDDAVDAVASGVEVVEAVDALIEAHKKKAKKGEKKDDDADDKGKKGDK